MQKLAMDIISRRSLKLLAYGALFMLTGCGPLVSFGESGPADDVYTLGYTGDYNASLNTDRIIYLEQPLMTSGLSGVGVAVALPDNQRTNLKGARWSSSIDPMIRNYLTQSLSASAGVKVLGDNGVNVRAACRMIVKVWSFQFAPGVRSSNDTVDIAIELSLVRYRDSQLLSQRVFTVNEKVNAGQASAVVAGFDAGMRTVGNQAGEWLAPFTAQCTQSSTD